MTAHQAQQIFKTDGEDARLHALYSLDLLDTPASEAFDRVTRMAAQLFKLPVAAVSLTDTDRQWFKSRVGVQHQSIPRLKAPCAEVAETADVLVIEDFATDPRYCDSLLGVNGTRFYAGAPLVTRDGFGLGALCVLGTEPRKVEPSEIAALQDLAAMVMDQIEMQHAFGRVDAISGLPNRLQFMEDLNDLAAEAPDQERIAAVICLGTSQQLEKYGRVFGSSYIDDLVRAAARRVQDVKGRDTRVYQVGAFQFAFLAPPGYAAQDYAARVQELFHQGGLSDNGHLLSSIATGVASFVTRADAPREVLQRLFSALHEARLSGTSTSIFSRDADEGYNRKFRMLHDFEAALQAPDQLRIVLQPRIDLKTGKTCSAEVLLRWRHPELGELSPAEFVPVIEASPLVHQLTNWVLEAALDVLSAHGGQLKLSVNISSADLQQETFSATVLGKLAGRGLAPSCLELEVTETVMMAHSDTSSDNLLQLLDAGVAIAIDDFGTGYSSLSYLQRLPVTAIKIDRSFILNLASNATDEALVDTLVGLAHKLGYQVVAEGIEDEAAAEILRKIGCEEGQGFHFSRPLELPAFTAWMAKQ